MEGNYKVCHLAEWGSQCKLWKNNEIFYEFCSIEYGKNCKFEEVDIYQDIKINQK